MPKRNRDSLKNLKRGEEELSGISKEDEIRPISNKSQDHDETPWSKSKKKRMRKIMGRNKRDELNNNNKKKSKKNQSDNQKKKASKNENETSASIDETSVPKLQSLTKKPLTALQQKFLSRLSGSRFRELNEELYTTNSSSALQRFQENPELFDQYHEGFRTQVKSWPVNPVDLVYKWILSFHNKHTNTNDSENQQIGFRIADFGCGDAKLAEKLLAYKSNQFNTSGKKGNKKSICPFKVNSFDLVANGNKLITPCDMANVPLKNSSIDIGVFVLALMGTNIADFIREAHRVLSPNGVLKIAEVRSRFESTTVNDGDMFDGGKRTNSKKSKQTNYNYSKKQLDDSLLNEFLDVMEELGFQCTKKDRQNQMFIMLEFKKTGVQPSKTATFTAKPCIYKKR